MSKVLSSADWWGACSATRRASIKPRLRSSGQRLAELGLAGSRRSIDENVDALFGGPQSPRHDPFDLIAIVGHVIEVGAAQLSGTGLVEKHILYVGTRALRKPDESGQPIDDSRITVLVHGYQA